MNFSVAGRPVVELIRKSPLATSAYRWMRSTLLRLVPPRRTPFGFMFVGPDAMVRGRFETDEVALVNRCLEHSDVFINIGAHIGYYCCIARNSGTEVAAFEPHPANARILRRNMMVNGWTDVDIYPMALGNREGRVDLYGSGTAASLVPGWAASSERFWRSVPISSLDKVMGNQLDGKRCLFLIDVEGFEKAVIEGAGHHLELTPAPYWIVEVCVDEHLPRGQRINPNLADTFALFWDHGYSCRTADQHLHEVDEKQIAEIVRTETNMFTTHNFVFCKGPSPPLFSTSAQSR